MRASNAPFNEWGFAELIRAVEELELSMSPTGSDLNQASSPVASGAGENVPASSSTSAPLSVAQVQGMIASALYPQIVYANGPTTALVSGAGSAALGFGGAVYASPGVVWDGTIFTVTASGYYYGAVTLYGTCNGVGNTSLTVEIDATTLLSGQLALSQVASLTYSAGGFPRFGVTARGAAYLNAGAQVNVAANQSNPAAANMTPGGNFVLVRIPSA